MPVIPDSIECFVPLDWKSRGLVPLFFCFTPDFAPTMSQIEHAIEALLAPVIQSLGLELWGIDYRGGTGNGLLRVYIDVAERAVTLEDCERASREISALMDVHDPIDSQYTLEVSSPGLDRPLFKAEQFARFIGETAKVEMEFPVDGRRRFQGAILAVNGDVVSLKHDGQAVELAVESMQKAKLVPLFEVPSKTGRGHSRKGVGKNQGG